MGSLFSFLGSLKYVNGYEMEAQVRTFSFYTHSIVRSEIREGMKICCVVDC
jgi:hypothetical protein